MKRPTWVTVVGILGIIFAALGFLGGAQTMIYPFFVDFQKDVFKDVREVAKAQPRDPRDPRRPLPPQADRMLRTFEKMFDIPEWYKTWSIAAGFVTILICGVYLFASISLLLVKPFAIRFFYWVSGVSIAFNVAKALVAMGIPSLLMASVWMNAALGIVMDVVLLSVVATSDKLAFEPALDVVDVLDPPANEVR